MATKVDIKKYRADAIEMMIDAIKHYEEIGIPVDDIWDNIRPDDYSYFATEEDKIKAFEKAGYTSRLRLAMHTDYTHR